MEDDVQKLINVYDEEGLKGLSDDDKVLAAIQYFQEKGKNPNFKEIKNVLGELIETISCLRTIEALCKSGTIGYVMLEEIEDSDKVISGYELLEKKEYISKKLENIGYKKSDKHPENCEA